MLLVMMNRICSSDRASLCEVSIHGTCRFPRAPCGEQLYCKFDFFLLLFFFLPHLDFPISSICNLLSTGSLGRDNLGKYAYCSG